MRGGGAARYDACELVRALPVPLGCVQAAGVVRERQLRETRYFDGGAALSLMVSFCEASIRLGTTSRDGSRPFDPCNPSVSVVWQGQSASLCIAQCASHRANQDTSRRRSAATTQRCNQRELFACRSRSSQKLVAPATHCNSLPTPSPAAH